MSRPHNTQPDLRHLVLDNTSVRTGTGCIEYGEFTRCTTLETVQIQSSSNITSIGELAFLKCTALQSIHLSENITSIGNLAFEHCTSLQSVHLSENITLIGDSAFGGCTSLQSISIPESVTYIGDGAFRGCTSLQSISIPGNIKSIGMHTFSGCESLKSISIPESVTSIKGFAFSGCRALQSISIPEIVTIIGDKAFHGCIALKSIHLSENSTTFIGNFAFYGCISLRSVSIPDSIVHVLTHAFDGCDTLNQRLPNGHNYQNDTSTWLRQRFNDLPIHQACYHFSNDMQQYLNHVSTLINENRESLAATDAMGMTALHILCCNPHATIEMVQLVVENDPSLLSLQDVTGSTPLKLFLECQGLLGADKDNNGEESDNDTDTEQELLMPSLCDLLRKGIRSKDLDIVLVLSRDLQAEATSPNPDQNTGLQPFMSAVTFPESGLDVVYTLAMKNLNILLSRGINFEEL